MLHLPNPEKWERRNNFQGMELKSAILHFYPYMIFEGNETSGGKGYSYDIMSILGKQLNFSVQYVFPEDNGWGIQKDNSTNYSGMIGMLQRYLH